MSYVLNIDFCEDYIWGEMEDYILIVFMQDLFLGVDLL